MKLLFLLFALVTAAAFSADIKGTVYGLEDGRKIPLQGANIYWLGSGTRSGADGTFSLPAPPGGAAALRVRYVGYEPYGVMILDTVRELEIVLKPSLSSEEIRVTGDLPSSLISQSDISATETITSMGLRKAACCNLSESFETNPSVDVNYSDAVTGAKQIELLGLSGVYTQILSEQMPMIRGLAIPYGLTYVPGTWMESIQISKGASSVVYGYESMAGQINIEYKKPEEMEEGVVNLFADIYGRYEANVDKSLQVSDNVFTGIFLSGVYNRTAIDHNHDSFMDRPMNENLNFMNRWKFFTDDYEGILGIKALKENRFAGSATGEHADHGMHYPVEIRTDRLEAFGKLGFFLEDERSIGTQYSFIYHGQNSLFGRRRYDGIQKTFFFNGLYETDLFGMSNRLMIGASFKADLFDESFDSAAYARDEAVPGIFAEYTYMDIEGLTMVGGLRFDRHNLFGNMLTPRFHLKYSPDESFALRLSAGRGFRTPNIFAENTALMLSSREFVIPEPLQLEESWNYGINATYSFSVSDMPMALNADIYRTDFVNQLVADADHEGAAFFYNLKGQSYSNSAQISLTAEPLKSLVLTAAYRYNQVKQTIDGALVDRPMNSRQKAFFNAEYRTGESGWFFDYTVKYMGSGKAQFTYFYPEEYRQPEYFPSFVTMNFQVTKKFGGLEIYAGAENLADYRQPVPVISAEDPYGPYFDSSNIWGPVMGVMAYAGIRYGI